MKHPSTGRVESTRRRVRSDLLARPRSHEANVAFLDTVRLTATRCAAARAPAAASTAAAAASGLYVPSPSSAASAASDGRVGGGLGDLERHGGTTGRASPRARRSAAPRPRARPPARRAPASQTCASASASGAARAWSASAWAAMPAESSQESADCLATIATRPAANATVRADADPLPERACRCRDARGSPRA